jgi:hypothetical protein
VRETHHSLQAAIHYRQIVVRFTHPTDLHGHWAAMLAIQHGHAAPQGRLMVQQPGDSLPIEPFRA